MSTEPVTAYVFNPHALFEMNRRGLREDAVRGILAMPEQRLEVRPGRVVLQSRIPMGEPRRTYLVCVFVDIDRNPAEVVTVYRTRKIAKYWRGEP